MSCTTMVYSLPRGTMYSSPCDTMYYLPRCSLMDMMNPTLALPARRHHRSAPLLPPVVASSTTWSC